MEDGLSAALAERIRAEREVRGWSLADLGERSGVSKAMISKVERGEASPTASLLGRLSGAFGLTLLDALGPRRAQRRPAGAPRRAAALARSATGYERRQVFASGEWPFELIEVELPAGAVVAFPAASLRLHPPGHLDAEGPARVRGRRRTPRAVGGRLPRTRSAAGLCLSERERTPLPLPRRGAAPVRLTLP